MTLRPTPPPATKRRKSAELTEWEMERDRQTAYRLMGLSKEHYTYPNTAYLVVEFEGRQINLLFPYIGGWSHQRVLERCVNLRQEYPNCVISITNPSKT